MNPKSWALALLALSAAFATSGCAYEESLEAWVMNGTESAHYVSVQVTFRDGEADPEAVLDFQGVVAAGFDTSLGVVGSSKGVYGFTAAVDNGTEAAEEFTFDHWNGLFRVDVSIESNETGEPEVRIFRWVT